MFYRNSVDAHGRYHEHYPPRVRRAGGEGPCRPQVTLALYTSPDQSAISQSGWDLHTVRGGVDPGGSRYRPGV